MNYIDLCSENINSINFIKVNEDTTNQFTKNKFVDLNNKTLIIKRKVLAEECVNNINNNPKKIKIKYAGSLKKQESVIDKKFFYNLSEKKYVELATKYSIQFIEAMESIDKQSSNDFLFFYKVISENRMDLIKLFYKLDEKSFSNCIYKKDKNDENILFKFVRDHDLKIVKLLAEIDPKIINEFILSSEKNQLLFLNKALKSDDVDVIKILILANPNVVVEISTEDSIKLLKYLIKKDFNTFEKVILNQNLKGRSFLYTAILENRKELIEFVAKNAPNTLKEAMSQKSRSGNTMINSLTLKNNLPMIQFLADLLPEYFEQLILSKNTSQYTALEIGKEIRVDKSIISFFKKYLTTFSVKELKEKKSLLLAAHLWNVGGNICLKSKKNKEEQIFLLEGMVFPSHLFHLINKNINQFNNKCPGYFNSDKIKLFKETIQVSADPFSYERKQIYQRIKKGLPVFLETGYPTHTVFVLIWGDVFGLCNCGRFSRNPIEFFQFDASRFLLRDLEEILNQSQNSKESYQELFFKTLPLKLSFKKIISNLHLESIARKYLQDQTIGNCNWTSLVAGVFAWFLLEGLQSNQELLEKTNKKEVEIELLDKLMKKEVCLFQNWLDFQQFHILKRLLNPLIKNEDTAFETNHDLINKIIVNASEKSYAEEKNENELIDLINKYLSTFSN